MNLYLVVFSIKTLSMDYYALILDKNYKYQVISIHETLEEARQTLQKEAFPYCEAEYMFVMKGKMGEPIIYPPP